VSRKGYFLVSSGDVESRPRPGAPAILRAEHVVTLLQDLKFALRLLVKEVVALRCE
jgi:hypothetical protein